MTSLSTKVKLYLEANGKTSSEIGAENANVQIVNEGTKDTIKVWNVSGLEKPTNEQLNAFKSEATKLENNSKVDATRRTSYGNWNEQLDEIYHNIDDWKARIKKIKDDNPKE